MNETDKDIDLENFMEDTDKFLNPELMKDGVKFIARFVAKFLMVLNLPGLLVGWIGLFGFFRTSNVKAFTFLTGRLPFRC